MVRLALARVDLMKLHALEMHSSRFSAMLWFEMIVRGGANDPDLSKEGEVFPIDPDTGKPTFRPSLGWYAAQVDMRNALSFKIVDSKVMKREDDLVMALRLEGVFNETFELDDFPVDRQGLTLMVNFNCRIGGPLPVEIVIDNECRITLSCITTCHPAKEWKVAPQLSIRTLRLGEEYSMDRVFPAICFTAAVKRKPLYSIINFGVPMGLFSLLSVLQSAVTERAGFNHRAQLTMMMVLTASAYKMSIASKLPAVSYLTMMDRYTLCNFGLIMVAAIQSRMLAFDFVVPPEQDDSGSGDLAWFIVLFSLWALVQAYYVGLGAYKYFAGRTRDYQLSVHESKEADDATRPPSDSHASPSSVVIEAAKPLKVPRRHSLSTAAPRGRTDQGEGVALTAPSLAKSESGAPGQGASSGAGREPPKV